MWFGEEDSVGGNMDELLEVLDYKVRSSDMANVAGKLEQLETALGAAPLDVSDVISFDTVHDNPSDLSSRSTLCSPSTIPPSPATKTSALSPASLRSLPFLDKAIGAISGVGNLTDGLSGHPGGRGMFGSYSEALARHIYKVYPLAWWISSQRCSGLEMGRRSSL